MIRVTLTLPPHVVDILDILVEEQNQTRSEIVGQLLLAAHPVKLIDIPDLFDQESERP